MKKSIQSAIDTAKEILQKLDGSDRNINPTLKEHLEKLASATTEEEAVACMNSDANDFFAAAIAEVKGSCSLEVVRISRMLTENLAMQIDDKVPPELTIPSLLMFAANLMEVLGKDLVRIPVELKGFGSERMERTLESAENLSNEFVEMSAQLSVLIDRYKLYKNKPEGPARSGWGG